jgi:hypothetical protein
MTCVAFIYNVLFVSLSPSDMANCGIYGAFDTCHDIDLLRNEGQQPCGMCPFW